MKRRDVLATLGWAALGLASPTGARTATPRRAWPEGDPFVLGVASGDPSVDGFALWTRLAPDPTSGDAAAPGGLRGEPIALDYEVARDEAFRDVAVRGSATAARDDAWSVHVEVRGLEPDRPYWYRFASGDAASRVGRARTIAAKGSPLARLKLGVASCSNYQHGRFAAYRHLTDEAPDVVLFLGDYIYEGIDKRALRPHSDGVPATTLAGYRNRYAQYRLDPDLQRLHAETTALVTWDDHEVQNDYANEWSSTFQDPAAFLARRAAAYRAFFEHMPVRASRVRRAGASMRIHQRVAFGDLAEIALLDGRQYRSRAACTARPDRGRAHLERASACPELFEPARSLLGRAQEEWLADGLASSAARWNVIAQDVLMAPFDQRANGDARDGPAYWTDDWNGYPAARARLFERIATTRPSNPLVLSGDIHSFWANDLKADRDPSAPAIATEFVGTSITSRPPSYEKLAACLPDNPHVRYFESRRRGYMTVTLSRNRADVAFRAIDDPTDATTPVSTLASFVVEDGRAGVVPA